MKATELLQLQTNADTQDNAKSISKNETAYERVEGTPFALIKEQNGWFIAIGRYKASDLYLTKEQAKKDIKQKDWDLLLNVMFVVADMINEHINSKNNKK